MNATTPSATLHAVPAYPDAFVRGSEVKPTHISWFWKPRIPKRGTTIVCGDPGIGKSNAMVSLLAITTIGGTFPDGTPAGPPADVVICASEDDRSSVLVPRLIASGADMTRVHFHVYEEDTSVQLDATGGGMDTLEQLIRVVHPAIVVFDTFDDYVGVGVNTWKSTSLRSALKKLHQLCKRYDFAVVLTTHLTKPGGTDDTRKAVERLMHSVGLRGVVRAIYAVASYKDGLCFGPLKWSWSEEPPSLLFVLESVPHPAPTLDNPDDTVPRVLWGEEVKVDIGRLLNGEDSTAKPTRIRACEQFLAEQLPRDGRSYPASPITKAAQTKGFEEKTIQRARKNLGITTKQTAAGWVWTWASS